MFESSTRNRLEIVLFQIFKSMIFRQPFYHDDAMSDVTGGGPMKVSVVELLVPVLTFIISLRKYATKRKKKKKFYSRTVLLSHCSIY